jgi:hypothetical protein
MERVRREPPDSVLIPHIPSQESKRRENGAGCVLDELKPLGYLGEGGWGRGEEGTRKGIPAANHDPPPVTRTRSTGLVQVFGGAGESES